MTLINKIEIVNKKIEELINCKNPKWSHQQCKLKMLLKLDEQLINKYNLEDPTYETLQFIEYIKTWRTENLNTEENLKDDIYIDIVQCMMQVKLQVMIKIHKKN